MPTQTTLHADVFGILAVQRSFALLAVIAALGTPLRAQIAAPGGAPAKPAVSAPQAWAGLSDVLFGNPGTGSPAPTDGKDPATRAAVLDRANKAKDFYTSFPGDPHAKDARRAEAVLLVNAVTDGDSASASRMEAAVQNFRGDSAVPAFDRAVVAGTYEFGQAGKRIKSPADMAREYEAVARGLIREFPDQPQGHLSLLAEAMQRNPVQARNLAMEVVGAAAAPAEVRAQAQRFVNRLDLVGQSVEKSFGPVLLEKGKSIWIRGRPGLVYFWATWSPDSLAFGEKLAGLTLIKTNVVGVCLDQNAQTAATVAATHRLPGRLVYPTDGAAGELATQLGADAAPLLYFADASGRFTDVSGLDDFEAKLAALGL